LFGQSGAHPAFAVASIKRGASGVGPTGDLPIAVNFKPGGRITSVNAPVRVLIQFAYAVHDSPYAGHSLPLLAAQVIGGPAWVSRDGYNIDAKAEGNTDQKQAWLMLQTLLADRFKLALHRETRELPVYDLTAAKSGLKLPAAKAVNCVSFPPGTTPHYVPGSADCGYVAGPFLSATGLRMQGRKLRMKDVAAKLAMVLDRPVLDNTGFTGDFDLNLNYVTDDAASGLPGADVPIILAAMEQVGLKLAPAKGPVEVLVIDHVERPTANEDVGIWGIRIPVGWGWAITNFVWWIGMGHTGALISDSGR
jgi:uncharacterized protein (TIGR03435 family)